MKRLNFGSGTKVKEGWDNADCYGEDGANLVFDFEKIPYPIKDNIYDYILADNVLEHLYHPEKVINELVRITKNKGVIEIWVPHMNTEGAFNLGHISYWTRHSFAEFANPPAWKHRKYLIKTISLELIPTTWAKWCIPFFLRTWVSRFLRGVWREIRFKGVVIK